MSDALLEAVRGLHVADPELGPKPLLAKLRELQLDLGAGNKEVREALTALKAESAAAEAAASQPAADERVPPAADEGAPRAANESGAPLPVALSLACIGCARLPSEMDDERDKHPICDTCRDEKLPTTFLCGVNCPANPGARELHRVFHKEVRHNRNIQEDGGVTQQWQREAVESAARVAAQTGDKYDELWAAGTRYASEQDWHRAARTYREAIALRPDKPAAYLDLGAALANSGHVVESAQPLLEAKERLPVGSQGWAVATANAFQMLRLPQCAEVAKPEWWNDEGLKALSARVLRAAPNEMPALDMRARVLSGSSVAWEAGPRSAAELKQAATHFDRYVALCDAPAWKAELSGLADECRNRADTRAKLEAEAKAVAMAEAEAKANAAADVLLAEEAAAAASAGKAPGNDKNKPKVKRKSSGNAAAQAAANQAQADAVDAAEQAAEKEKAEVHARRLLQKWASLTMRIIAQARADAKATADNAAAAAKQRAVREQADTAAAAKAESGYTPAGPSHKGPAVAWGERAPDARDKAKRVTAKEASIEAAKKAEAEKKAEEARKTAEDEARKLEQLRMIAIGEAITSGK